MPEPNHVARNSESLTGCCVTLAITALLVALPHSVYATSRDPTINVLFSSVGAREIGFICLYIEASLALVCLLGLLFGDPGTLKRSPQRCFPLPQLVAEKLRQGQTLSRMENIHEGGQVFCVRCCIWRPDASPPHYQDTTHHCSTCQRCVTHFDHHCGVRGKPARQACAPSLRAKPARQACELSSSSGRTPPQAFRPLLSLIAHRPSTQSWPRACCRSSAGALRARAGAATWASFGGYSCAPCLASSLPSRRLPA